MSMYLTRVSSPRQPKKKVQLAEQVAGAGAAPEEEGGLHETEHAGSLEVVEEAVGEDEEARGAARAERAPPPPVVLDGELEVPAILGRWS
jgi:hypothetical protein